MDISCRILPLLQQNLREMMSYCRNLLKSSNEEREYAVTNWLAYTQLAHKHMSYTELGSCVNEYMIYNDINKNIRKSYQLRA